MVTGRGLANGCYRIDLVRIERDEFLDREHLVVRPLVAPGRVFRTVRERVVRRLALERAMGLVARAHEPLHLHVLARDVVDDGGNHVADVRLVELERIARVGDELALELDLHAHARGLGRDAMVRIFLPAGTAVGAHVFRPSICCLSCTLCYELERRTERRHFVASNAARTASMRLRLTPRSPRPTREAERTWIAFAAGSNQNSTSSTYFMSFVVNCA